MTIHEPTIGEQQLETINVYIILYLYIYIDNTWYNLQISKAERGHAVVQKELVNSKKEETRRGAHLSDDVVTLFQTLEP